MFLVRGRAKYLLLILLISFASITHAIGFGNLKVYSYLGEPLVAEIELTNIQNIDSSMLKVNLANAKDFVRAGIDRPYVLTSLVFNVITYKDKPYIIIRTAKPIQIAYLEFLIELSWPEGNLIKEYTILLDPPPANLTKENRPQAISQLAEAEAQAQAKAFGADKIQTQIEMQAAAKQRAAAETTLANVVKVGKNKFVDQTFDIDLPQKKEGADLVPGVVPEVLEDELQANRQAYELQKQNFEQTQQANAAKEKQKSSNTLLGKVITDLEDTKTTLNNKVSIDEILADERAQSQQPVQATTPTPPTTPALDQHAAVDFNQVIAPTGPPIATGTTPPVETTSVPAPSAPIMVPSTIPVAESKGGSNLFYLGIILSLFLVAVGVAVAIKRGMFAKRMPIIDTPPTATSTTKETEPTVSEKSTTVLDTSIADLTPEDADAEHIELSSPVDVEKFEQEFENIDLDALGTPPPTEADLAGAIEDIKPTLIKTSSDLAADEKISLASSIVQETKHEEEIIPPTMLHNDNTSFVPPMSMPEPTQPDQITETKPIETASNTTTSPEENLPIGSGLRLSEEGATLLRPEDKQSHTIDNSEAIELKLNLAKQYLDAGDKESAKELLNEIIETANDQQKVEAKVLLSSIV